jgi:hypothetical protein
MPYGQPGLRDYLSMMWAAVRYRFWRPETTTPSRLAVLKTTSGGKSAHRTWPDLPNGEGIATGSESEQGPKAACGSCGHSEGCHNALTWPCGVIGCQCRGYKHGL